MPATPAPQGWQWSALTDLARLESGHTPSRKHPEYWGGEIPWISIGDARAHDSQRIDDTEDKTNELGIANSSARVLPKNTVCLSRTASVGYVVVMGRPMATSQDFVNWVCSRQLNYNFLKYLFIAEHNGLLRFASGAVHQTIYFPEVKAFHICHPPLAEQQRIVGVLDEAMAGLATAKAHAERNLQNARALFESCLQSVFTNRGPGWTEKKLSDVCAIMSRLVDPRKPDFLDLTHVGAGNIESFTGALLELKTAREEGLISGKFLFDASMVLYSKIRPYLMKVARPDFSGLCSADIYPLAPLANQADRNFLFYLLLTKRFTEYAERGSARAGMPKVNREHLFEFKARWPPVEAQAEIAAKLDAVAAQTQRLATTYKRKLAALDALRKSLLHQAFTGELTKDWTESKIVAFPQAVPGISVNDLHAGLLAMAYQRHEAHGKQADFGHVKGEKIIHLMEAFVGLELGRTPVKDAAGPNDFPHLHRVEHRARKADFFDFKRAGDRGPYRVVRLPKFDELIQRTEEALGARKPQVDQLLELMVKLDWQQAEIVATVFAAWNNLLLDGAEASEERIVFEARDGWHPDKLQIEHWRFLGAIKWMREHRIIPEGKGKRVSRKISKKHG
jgi:type I restriction enzyme, S subunit